jgi:hypothetical protein
MIFFLIEKSEDHRKDFVEKVNEANMRRSQAFSGNPHNQALE